MVYHIISLFAGFILDSLLGEPAWIFHPVRGMGMTIDLCEKIVRKYASDNKKKLLSGGILLAAANICFWGMISYALCYFAYGYNIYAGMVLESFMCFQLLAARSLKSESMKVYKKLQDGDTEGARKAVSMIVGRDTERLDSKGIIKAAVETVAENLSDGVIAPMIYMAVGGVWLGYIYKTVNTMDSMIGYKSEKYLYIGRAAAKLDDILNYIPSRLSALLMIAASPLAGLSAASAFRIWKRDRRKHSSPNAAQTESVAAGALGIQLAGPAFYFGSLYPKQYIGDIIKEPEPEDIVRINRLMYITVSLCMLLILAVCYFLSN